nr:hypothetical protein [Streptomyces sp. ISL-99]
MRVSVRSVQRWRQAWDEGGPRALGSQGPVSLPRLSLPAGPWNEMTMLSLGGSRRCGPARKTRGGVEPGWSSKTKPDSP